MPKLFDERVQGRGPTQIAHVRGVESTKLRHRVLHRPLRCISSPAVSGIWFPR
jgi:hypothetical protein